MAAAAPIAPAVAPQPPPRGPKIDIKAVHKHVVAYLLDEPQSWRDHETELCDAILGRITGANNGKPLRIGVGNWRLQSQALAVCLAAIMLHSQDIRIVVFATGMRAVSALMESVLKRIRRTEGSYEKIVKKTQEQLWMDEAGENRSANGPRRLSIFPESVVGLRGVSPDVVFVQNFKLLSPVMVNLMGIGQCRVILLHEANEPLDDAYPADVFDSLTLPCLALQQVQRAMAAAQIADPPVYQINLAGIHAEMAHCVAALRARDADMVPYILPYQVPVAANAPRASAPVVGDEDGLDPDEIRCVVEEARCTRAVAISALKRNGNIVDAILELIP